MRFGRAALRQIAHRRHSTAPRYGHSWPAYRAGQRCGTRMQVAAMADFCTRRSRRERQNRPTSQAGLGWSTLRWANMGGTRHDG
jgi:hypothetical protein